MMRWRAAAVVIALAALVATPAHPQPNDHSALMQRLVDAYPDHLTGFEGNEIIWKDGTRMPFDDGKTDKSFEELLDTPDLEDMFAMPYPRGRAGPPPGFQADPGRIRYEPFFEKMYGDCDEGEVTKRLLSVDWLPSHGGGRVQVTSVNGVADRLRAVSAELDKLPKPLIAYLKPTAGAYNCRSIAGTKRKSVHASGAAIDINVAKADYWRWSKPGRDGRYPYKNQIPWEIVGIFERHGFIWSGKWYHYDTMHFEYRPELLTR